MTSVSPSFADNSASQDSTIKVAYLNKYGVSKYEDVASYIQNSTETETIKILDEYVTYYYGENYTIVKDSGGYSKVYFGEDEKIFVNEIEVESRISYADLKQEEFDLSLPGPLAVKWIPYGNTTYREYNVIGIAPGVIGAIIAGPIGADGPIGAEIGSKVGTVFDIVGGAIVGTIVGGRFPEYYVSIKSQSYYKTPVTTSRPEIKTINRVYHGPKYNRYQTYWFNHTSL